MREKQMKKIIVSLIIEFCIIIGLFSPFSFADNNVPLAGDKSLVELSTGGKNLLIKFSIEKGFLQIFPVEVYCDGCKLGTFSKSGPHLMVIQSNKAKHILQVYRESNHKVNLIQDFMFTRESTMSITIKNHVDSISVENYTLSTGIREDITNLSPILVDQYYFFTDLYMGRTISTKRGHVEEFYFFDPTHNIMVKVTETTSSGHPDEYDFKPYKISIDSDGKIRTISDGKKSDTYYKVSKGDLYYCTKDGKQLEKFGRWMVESELDLLEKIGFYEQYPTVDSID